jgi:predicted DNA-binding transcriptional regulator YafY
MSGDNEIVREQLLEAIEAKREIELHYEREGSGAGERRVAPHALFRSGDKRLFLYAFQTEGASNRNELPGWRRFALESIKSVKVLDDQFELQDDYDPAWKAFSGGLINSVH